MKTAISIPDELHSRVTKKAHQLGMSRSELFAKAAERYLNELDAPAVTAMINDVLARVEGAQESNLAAAAAGRARLAEMQDDW